MSADKSIGILYDRIRWEEKELAHQLEVRGVTPTMVDAKSLVLALDDAPMDSLPKVILERCVSYYRGTNVANVFESHGIQVINSSRVLNLCGNKLETSQFLAKHGIPTPRTIVAFSVESALQAVEAVGYPCVMKPIVGSWGRQVVPVRDRETAEALIEMRDQSGDSMQSVYYVQEMVKRPPRDVRCIAVGEEIAASVYRYAPSESWKTNVALGGHTEPCKMTPQLEELLLRTVSIIGQGVLGIDVMERGETGSQEFVIHEINGTVEFKGAQAATEQSIAGRIAEYLLKKVSR